MLRRWNHRRYRRHPALTASALTNTRKTHKAPADDLATTIYNSCRVLTKEGQVQRFLKFQRSKRLQRLNIPVLLCLNYQSGRTTRIDKRPMLSDLRESGSIEQDADVVMFTFIVKNIVLAARTSEGTEEICRRRKNGKVPEPSGNYCSKTTHGPIEHDQNSL